MVDKSERTYNKLQELDNTFSENDYYDYLYGNITLKDLIMKYNVTLHILLLYFKNKNWINKRTYLYKNFKENLFDDFNNSTSCYIFGLYTADGNLTKNNFCISLSSQDEQILSDIRDAIIPNKKLYITKSCVNKAGIKSVQMTRLCFMSKHIAQKLTSLGFGKNKTYLTKNIKGLIPKRYFPDFVRGFFDGDGCISTSQSITRHKLKSGEIKEYKSISLIFNIVSRDDSILKDIQEMFKQYYDISLNIYPDSRGNYLIATSSRKQIEKIFQIIYPVNCQLKLNRKYNKFKNIIGNTVEN